MIAYSWAYQHPVWLVLCKLKHCIAEERQQRTQVLDKEEMLEYADVKHNDNIGENKDHFKRWILLFGSKKETGKCFDDQATKKIFTPNFTRRPDVFSTRTYRLADKDHYVCTHCDASGTSSQ